MEESNIIKCENAQCDYWRDDECTCADKTRITPNPETNADCHEFISCYFEWE